MNFRCCLGTILRNCFSRQVSSARRQVHNRSHHRSLRLVLTLRDVSKRPQCQRAQCRAGSNARRAAHSCRWRRRTMCRSTPSTTRCPTELSRWTSSRHRHRISSSRRHRNRRMTAACLSSLQTDNARNDAVRMCMPTLYFLGVSIFEFIERCIFIKPFSFYIYFTLFYF